jgi:hypothetical protein
MNRYYIIFKNGVKFFIMADSFTLASGRYRFIRSGQTLEDFVVESEVGAILKDGTIEAPVPVIG